MHAAQPTGRPTGATLCREGDTSNTLVLCVCRLVQQPGARDTKTMLNCGVPPGDDRHSRAASTPAVTTAHLLADWLTCLSPIAHDFHRFADHPTREGVLFPNYFHTEDETDGLRLV